ncbi:MAG: UMP kinase [Minwuia sp.]|uniref:UMP kinase n=1 Tax=Minwuia sp. TaxID=2493630 RepID=UPI003A8BAC30
MDDRPAWNRVLLKCSGEALMGDGAFGIDFKTLERIAGDIAEVRALGVQVAVVVGGGNLFRGVKTAASGMDRASADQMGMLATVMNGLALADALQRGGAPAVCMSAIPMTSVCPTYTRRDAVAALETGQVMISSGGTGNPFFTTDTAAALRAAELGCDLLAKGTQVDGVYSADPKTNPDAVRLETISHSDALARGISVMDTAAIALTQENRIPVMVFDLHRKGGFAAALTGRGRSSTITVG